MCFLGLPFAVMIRFLVNCILSLQMDEQFYHRGKRKIELIKPFSALVIAVKCYIVILHKMYSDIIFHMF